MVLWSVDVIHLTKFLPFTEGCGATELIVGRSAYVVMLGSP